MKPGFSAQPMTVALSAGLTSPTRLMSLGESGGATGYGVMRPLVGGRPPVLIAKRALVIGEPSFATASPESEARILVPIGGVIEPVMWLKQPGGSSLVTVHAPRALHVSGKWLAVVALVATISPRRPRRQSSD